MNAWHLGNVNELLSACIGSELPQKQPIRKINNTICAMEFIQQSYILLLCMLKSFS